MATKKECDRCGRQWEADTFSEKELCLVTFNMPFDESRIIRPEVHKTIEMCQKCGREVYTQARTPPKGAGS